MILFKTTSRSVVVACQMSMMVAVLLLVVPIILALTTTLPTTDAFSPRTVVQQQQQRHLRSQGDIHDRQQLFHAVTFIPKGSSSSYTMALSGSTTAIPETERKLYTPKSNPSQKTDSQGKKPFVNDKALTEKGRGNRMEYLQDDLTELRGMNDPHHILLMGYETFLKERITIPYVQGSLMYVLDMPESEALDHANFAKDEGISCLGTWTRQECLTLGGKLMQRDIVCRIVPGTPAGAQGWQAKDASASTGENIYNDVPSISSAE